MWNQRPIQQGDDDDDDDETSQQHQPDPPPTADDTALLFPPPAKPSTSPSPSKYRTFPHPHPHPHPHSSSSSSSPRNDPHPDDSERASEPSTSRTSEPPFTAKAGSAKEGGTVFIYLLSCFAAIGGMLFGYDTGIISGSMLLMQPYFQLSTFWEELVVSGTIGAAAATALAAGALCDRVGRRKVIMAASVIFTAGAAVMGAAQGKETLLVGRIVVGVGIGLASVAVPVYIAESAPAHIRGLLVTLTQLFITIGILISSIIAGAFSELKSTGWRYMLGLAGIPGVIQFCGFLFLPESPRWLVAKGREEEARRVLRCTRGYEDVEDEITDIKGAESNKQTGFVLGQMLKTPHVRRALIVGCGLQFFQQLCGINTVIYYSGTILKEAGFHVSQAIWLVCVPFTVNCLATFIGIATVDRLGRRILLVFSFVGITVALIILSVGFLLSNLYTPPVNATIAVHYPNGSKVTDQCQGFELCEDCINTEHCGYCYDPGQPGLATCLLAQRGDEDNGAAYGRCGHNYTGVGADRPEWTFGFCPTDYGWMAVLGLALFVFSFAPGLGPMPWTVNSEIYPMWARGTGVSVATMTNWTCNLLVSFTFLTLFHAITKYGTFFLFAGISVLGLAFTLLLVPETRNKTLEEMEEVFMTSQQRQQRQQQQQQQQQRPHSPQNHSENAAEALNHSHTKF